MTFVDNGTKVAASTVKSFVFLPEQSVGDPAVDLVTTINIPALVSNAGPSVGVRKGQLVAWGGMIHS